ncbi:hypothetical protein [Mycoplasma sp. HS2188]|uniref:hypothetical protein n=1 Tax=Mycoplasma sp. HS2188 TaxID=2976765 RepID=UPI0021AA0E46|nr:hypothetical protein [Mycoplasma sp. HS2188]MCT4469795.1 hypothetical protein [Mycoplasma sp. HS2188]
MDKLIDSPLFGVLIGTIVFLPFGAAIPWLFKIIKYYYLPLIEDDGIGIYSRVTKKLKKFIYWSEIEQIILKGTKIYILRSDKKIFLIDCKNYNEVFDYINQRVRNNDFFDLDKKLKKQKIFLILSFIFVPILIVPIAILILIFGILFLLGSKNSKKKDDEDDKKDEKKKRSWF